jgi:hypothetical protein
LEQDVVENMKIGGTKKMIVSLWPRRHHVTANMLPAALAHPTLPLRASQTSFRVVAWGGDGGVAFAQSGGCIRRKGWDFGP